MKKFVHLFVISLITIASLQAQDIDVNEEVYDLSLEELMNIEVTVGNISGTSNLKLPLSVTTISRSDIEVSNAQNLLHLLQLYVPGVTYTRHDEGPMIGLRGIISDRNNKLLMVIDGIVVNQRAHNGVTTDLENWDLGDIEKIEVIRGPGSVTYGPGAIAGVINIQTRKPGDLSGLKLSAGYVTGYENKTFSASYGFNKANVKGIFHASVARTNGLVPDGMYLNDSILGERGNPDEFLTPAATYMRDYDDKPQVKFLGGINFSEDFTVTARFNRSGATIGGYLHPQTKLITGFDGDNNAIRTEDFDDIFFQSQQQFQLTAENRHEFSSIPIEINSSLTYLSSDYQRTQRFINEGFLAFFGASDPVQAADNFDDAGRFYDANSLDNPMNLLQNFSENAFVANVLGVYKISDEYKFALGVEYVNTKFGSGWGDDERDLRMGDFQNIISGPNSFAARTENRPRTINVADRVENKDFFFVGDGWSINDIGLVAEANLGFTPLFNVLLSGRLDKNTFSDWLLSPRLAIISEINNKNVLKFVLQRSQKINTAEQLLIADRTGVESDIESIFNAEVIYTTLLGENSKLNISGFYNDQDAIGWNRVAVATTPIADIQMAGLEIDYQLQYSGFTGGINHSYIKQLDYQLKADSLFSNISYANYFINGTAPGQFVNIGHGNDLVGIPVNSTKLYLNKYFSDKKYILHTELAAFWGFEGSKSVQEVARDSKSNPTTGQKVFDAYQKAFDDENLFGTSIFWNATFTAKPIENLSIMVGVHNILGGNLARIDEQIQTFTKSFGGSQSFVSDANYFIEPRTYSFKVSYEFPW